MAGSKKFVVNAKEAKFATTTNEDQSVVLVVENRFIRTICNDQSVKNVVVVPSANIKRSGQSVEAVTEDLFVSMRKSDIFVGPAMEIISANISNKKIDVQIAIPLDILPALYAIVFILA